MKTNTGNVQNHLHQPSVLEGAHSLENSQSPLKINGMAFLKNANKVSASLTDD